MKKAIFFVIIISSIYSCKKGAVDTIASTVDPRPMIIIGRDTLANGQFWGLTIGEGLPNIYSILQNIRSERNIGYLGIVANIFTELNEIEEKIPLYRSVFLDETKGTETGIQIYFFDNKIKSIWTNSGTQLNRWPIATENSASIKPGDRIDAIYGKLVKIKKISLYKNKFERISLFDKDLFKPYDPQMSFSPQWYFTAKVEANKYYLIELNFKSGILNSIFTTLYEY